MVFTKVTVLASSRRADFIGGAAGGGGINHIVIANDVQYDTQQQQRSYEK